MKNKLRSILFAASACALVSLSACSQSLTGGTGTTADGSPTPTASAVKVTPEQVRQSAAFATTAALTFDKNAPADSAMAYTAAAALNSLATGKAVAPSDVAATLKAFGGSNTPAYYSLIVTGVSAVWANVYPNLPKDDKSAGVYMAALAAGVQDGAAPFMPVAKQ